MPFPLLLLLLFSQQIKFTLHRRIIWVCRQKISDNDRKGLFHMATNMLLTSSTIALMEELRKKSNRTKEKRRRNETKK
jgi:hypothetical protein